MIRRILPILLAFAIAGPAAAQSEIGKATSITVQVTGAAGGLPRVLKNGDGVFENERIATDAKGVGQFEFLDATRLAVGPGSAITLDRFVYDGNRKATDVAIELGRGAFRFISGRSPSQVYKITTSTATLGVRGTSFDLYVTESGAVCVAMINGSVQVCPRGAPCRLHNIVGRFLLLAPDGSFSLLDRWDGALLGGATFATAMPFLASQTVLLPAFRAAPTAVSRYARVVPDTLEKAGKAIPKVIETPLRLLNPFR